VVEAPTAMTEAPTPVTASSDNTGNTNSTGTLTGPAADLLNKTQQAMKDIKTFHYTMQIESGGTVSLTGEGDFETPDKARITMKNIPGTAGTVEMVIFGKDTYMKQAGSEQYMSLGDTGSGLMGLGGLSNPSQTSSITQFADSADIVGDENVDGLEATHITFTYDPNKAMQASTAMTGAVATAIAMATPTSMKSKADAWVDKSTGYIHKIKFVTQTTNPSPQANPVGGTPTTTESTITLTYSKFNEPINPPIEKPTNVITLPNEMGTPVPVGTPVP
jgi:outer membrane lipoprotein-sorting protein